MHFPKPIISGPLAKMIQFDQHVFDTELKPPTSCCVFFLVVEVQGGKASYEWWSEDQATERYLGDTLVTYQWSRKSKPGDVT